MVEKTRQQIEDEACAADEYWKRYQHARAFPYSYSAMALRAFGMPSNLDHSDRPGWAAGGGAKTDKKEHVAPDVRGAGAIAAARGRDLITSNKG